MLRILINAYACCPDMGSEQGMAWNFISRIAKFCEVFVITESEYKDVNLAAISYTEDMASVNEYGLSRIECERIHFCFIPAGNSEEETQKIRTMCWNQGTWAFYFYYSRWQMRALSAAREIIESAEASSSGIDVMHQLNMAGFREPGMLYKINEERLSEGIKPIPLVWGPMTGYGSIPFRFMIKGGLKFTAFYSIKNILNDIQLMFHPRVRKMIKASDKLLCATPEMRKGLKRYYRIDAEQFNETACNDNREVKPTIRKRFDDTTHFKILWVGRFIYTKQLDLAIETISRIKDIPGLEFHIVGRGFTDAETEHYRQYAENCGINDVCIWHGQIPNSEVHRIMQESHVFFFSSIFEATSTVILEAIQNYLPIVCFDRCGFGPIVDSEIGIKIPCSSPSHAVSAFAKNLRMLSENRNLLSSMSEHCKEKQIELSWTLKIERLIEIYSDLSERYTS